MELTVKLNLDCLDEDGTLDDAVKNQIIDRVVEILDEKVIEQIGDVVQKRIEAKLDALITETYEKFMNSQVTLTDNWGEVRYRDVKIVDLIKEKLDKALDQRVDDSGYPVQYGGRRRLDYLLDDKIKRAVDQVAKHVNSEIERRFVESVRQKLGEALVAKIDVESTVREVLSKIAS